MKEFCEKGESIAMVNFGVESARIVRLALVADMKARGIKPEVERWKREAKEMLSQEHYQIWETQFLPIRLEGWYEEETIEVTDLHDKSGKSDAKDPESGD